MLHTGGSFWVDVTGIEGTRDSVLLRWVPGSPRIELGLLRSALMSLPLLSDAWGQRVSHFVLGLSPRGPSPVGESGQLAVAISTLWYRHAANAGLPLVRAGAGADQERGAPPADGRPLVVLTGSGTLRQRRTAHGLFGYCVEPVYGWEDKLRQLDAAIAGLPVAALHLVCAHVQMAQVRAALLHVLSHRVQPGRDELHFLFDDGRGRVDLYLHPVTTLTDVANVVDGLAAPGPGAAPGHASSPAQGSGAQALAAHDREAAGDAAARAGAATAACAMTAVPGRTGARTRTGPVPIGVSRTGSAARRRAGTGACRVPGRASVQGRHRARSGPIHAPPGRAWERSGRHGTARHGLSVFGLVRVILLWLLIGSLGALLAHHCTGRPGSGPPETRVPASVG